MFHTSRMRVMRDTVLPALSIRHSRMANSRGVEIDGALATHHPVLFPVDTQIANLR